MRVRAAYATVLTWLLVSPGLAQEPPTAAPEATPATTPTAEAPTPPQPSGPPPAPAPTAATPSAPADAAPAARSACAAKSAPNAEYEAPGCTPRRPPHVARVPDVASLKTPESPAFMALGVVPSEIQRPSTPSGLKASLANGIARGKNLDLMQSFAMEVSPFWLIPHRSLTYDDLVDERWHSFYRNLSLSFATSPDEVDVMAADGTEAKLERGRGAVGVRTTLVPGVPTAGAEHCHATIKEVLAGSVAARDSAERVFLAEWAAAHPEPPPAGTTPPLNMADYDKYKKEGGGGYTEEGKARLTADQAAWLKRREAFDRQSTGHQAHLEWLSNRDAALRAFRQKYASEHLITDATFQRCLMDIHAREGFMLEAAWALDVALPDGDWKRLDEGGSLNNTIWVTPGLIFDNLLGGGVEGSLVLVGRYQRQSGAPGDSDREVTRLDAGARVGVAFERFGAAVEGTVREQTVDASADPGLADATLYRTALSLDYRLDSGLWLTATFGRDFGDGVDDAPILALANLQWNFDLERQGVIDQGVTQ